MCVFIIVLQIPQAFAELKWHSNDRFPARSWAICTCLFSVKANKLKRLPATICLSWLGSNSATGLGQRRVAQSRSPVVYADSDVVPTVRCQQAEGGRAGSQHGCGMLCGERKDRKPVPICVFRICGCVFSLISGYRTRLMVGVEVFKGMLQLLHTEPIHQIWPTIVTTALHSLVLWLNSRGLQ